MSYLILYTVVLFIMYFLSVRFRKSTLPIIFLAILSIFRFDTTSDYIRYVQDFYNIGIGWDSRFEYGYILLNDLFRNCDHGYIAIFALGSFCVYYTMYCYFKRYDVLALGTLLFVAFGTVIEYDNILRQCFAISIVYFAFFRYLYGVRKLPMLLLMIAFASLFHVSAWICLLIFPFLPLLQRKFLSPTFICVLTMFAVVMSILGVFDLMFTRVASLFQVLSIADSHFSNYGDFEAWSNDIGFIRLFKIILSTLPCLMLNHLNRDKNCNREIIMCINITWMLNIAEIVFLVIPFASRIFTYLFIFKFISIAYFIRNYQFVASIFQSSWFLLRKLIYVFLFLVSYVTINGYYGSENKYTSIFCDRRYSYLFYKRKSYSEILISGTNYLRDDFVSIRNKPSD